MGKMFSNVYLDLVWLPQISREKAVLAFDEMLDCVPYNKIFRGGDCSFIEEEDHSKLEKVLLQRHYLKELKEKLEREF